MAKFRRKIWDQITHDDKVRELAEKYVNDGWTVYADVDSYTTPFKVNGYIPDIIAARQKKKKGKKVTKAVIIEVETKCTAKTRHAKQQNQAFQKEADSTKNIRYCQIIV